MSTKAETIAKGCLLDHLTTFLTVSLAIASWFHSQSVDLPTINYQLRKFHTDMNRSQSDEGVSSVVPLPPQAVSSCQLNLTRTVAKCSVV